MPAKARQATVSGADLSQLTNCLVVASRWIFGKSSSGRFAFFQAIGRILGARLAAAAESKKIEDRIREVPMVCRNLKLGDIRIVRWEPLLFVVHPSPSSLRADSIRSEEMFAAFREGVLDAFITEGLESDPFVKHTFAAVSSNRRSR